MIHRSDGATAPLGMPGFVVGAQVLIEDEWWLHAQADTGRAAAQSAARGPGSTAAGG